MSDYLSVSTFSNIDEVNEGFSKTDNVDDTASSIKVEDNGNGEESKYIKTGIDEDFFYGWNHSDTKALNYTDYTYLLDGHNGFVAGDFLMRIGKGRTREDVPEIYFRNEKDLNEAKMYFAKNSDVVKCAEGFRVSLITHEAILSAKVGTPEQILDSFDFTVVQCALIREGESYYLLKGRKFDEHCENRVVEYIDGCLEENKRLYRLAKYVVNYGFIPKSETIREIFKKFISDNDEISSYGVDEVIEGISEIHSPDNIKYLYSVTSKELYSIEVIWKACRTLTSGLHYLIRSDFDFNRAAIHCIKTGVNRNQFLLESEASKNLNRLLRKVNEITIVLDDYKESMLLFSEIVNFLNMNESLFNKPDLKNILYMLGCCGFVPSTSRWGRRHFGVEGVFKTLSECHFDKGCRNTSHKRSGTKFHVADVVLKTFKMFDNDEWIRSVSKFWGLFYYDIIDDYPTLEEWFKLIDEGNFDPHISPAILTLLAINE